MQIVGIVPLFHSLPVVRARARVAHLAVQIVAFGIDVVVVVEYLFPQEHRNSRSV